MTVYNKEIFEQAGVTELPTNWEEFKEVCRVIKEKTGVTPYVVAGGCNHNDQMTCHMMLGNGVNVTDADGNAAFDSQGAIETLQFFGDLMDEGLMSEGSAGYTESDVLQLFANGEVAIWSGNTPSSIATPEFIDKIGVMPNFPAKEGGEARGLGFFNSMVAFEQSKYPEACKVFLKWYIEHSLPLFTQGGVTTLPIMDSQLQDPFYQDNALLKQVVENVIPTVLILIPLFMIVKTLGLFDSLWSIILCYTAISLPLAIWIIKGFFDTIPRDIEESAFIDGCSRIQSFLRIVLPVSLPGVASAAVITFNYTWNEYMLSNLFINNDDYRTLTAGLATFVEHNSTQWGYMMAGAVLGTIPALLAIIFAQKYVVQGLSAGAVKG